MDNQKLVQDFSKLFKEALRKRFRKRQTISLREVEQTAEDFAKALSIALEQNQMAVQSPPVQEAETQNQASSDEEQVLWEGRPQWTWDWFMYKFEFDTFELRIKTGFLSRDLEKIPLKRIQDISLQQTFWERLLNIGRIRITTSDASAPAVVLFAIAYPDFVLKQLQEAVRNARQAAGVRLREDV